MRPTLIVVMLALVTGLSVFAAASEFAVEVVVTGADSGVVQVLVSVFDAQESYLKSPLL